MILSRMVQTEIDRRYVRHSGEKAQHYLISTIDLISVKSLSSHSISRNFNSVESK